MRSEESGERGYENEGLEGKANSHGGAVSAHPGGIDRMAGAKVSKETGPSHPKYLPKKGGRRR